MQLCRGDDDIDEWRASGNVTWLDGGNNKQQIDAAQLVEGMETNNFFFCSSMGSERHRNKLGHIAE